MVETKKEITKELRDVFAFIKNELSIDFPTDTLSTQHFILATLEKKDCTAYKILSNIMVNDSLKLVEHWYKNCLTGASQVEKSDSQITKIDPMFDKYIKVASTLSDETESDTISSAHLLCAIFKEQATVTKCFKIVNVNYEQLYKQLLNYYNRQKQNKLPSNKLKSEKKIIQEISDKNNSKNSSVNKEKQIDKNLSNLNELASINKIDHFIGGDDLYKRVFKTFSKKNCKNIIVTGDDGIGKRTFIRNIANLIVKNQVPNNFKDKIVVEIDFNKLFANSSIRGMFEQKMLSIINEAEAYGNYIFVFDSLSTPFNMTSKTEIDISVIFKKLCSIRNANVITCASNKAYNAISEDYNFIKTYFDRIQFEEPTINQTINILENIKETYEVFHNVKFSAKTLEVCAKLAKEYITDKNLPLSAINVLDELGASNSIIDIENDEIKSLESKLNALLEEKETYQETKTNDINYSDNIDQYLRNEIKLKNKIANLKKKYILQKTYKEITEDDVRKEFAIITNMPLEKIDKDEKYRLKNLEDTLKKTVVGQDDAIEKISKSIRRKRLGLGVKGKPPVFLFLGSTGVGKTYLAKKIAEQIFGSDKYLVRLDMSEYTDQTSCNKLIGSSSGYVGYNEGGILTNALKNKKYCVLLLDEIEKAHSDVFNLFLQLFDDGRITDNKGNRISCKDLIIIMTSNVGAKEISSKAKPIGFYNDNSNGNNDSINKALKNKFSPEFLNRINNIVYFNKLSEDNLKSIIKLELVKVKDRIEETGNKVDESFFNRIIIDMIFDKMKESKEFGARPILRCIEELIEDRVAEILLEKTNDDHYIFKDKDFLNGNDN